MKLQAKFTINLIALVVLTLITTFVVINWNFQTQFNHFIKEKNAEWKALYIDKTTNTQENINKITVLPLNNPFDENQPNRDHLNTPEQRYLNTVSSSLLWSATITIVIAIILAYLISHLLLQKIFSLKSAMQQYMQNGKNKPVLHEATDEIDDLANIYNNLIEKIEKEEKIRKDFFIDMSHELRTPLTSIKGYLEGLIDHVFDASKEHEIHEKTLGETNRMIHLVKEMTTLAKLETEKPELNKIPTNLHQFTQEIVDLLQPNLSEKNLTITVEGNAETTIDHYKFKQVIINLLDNAIQYGKPNSNIAIKIHQDKQTTWKITNTAENLSPEQTDFFFERFYRGDKSRNYKAEKPHLGIGLNIVKKIVEQHDGKISAHTENQEITFEITL